MPAREDRRSSQAAVYREWYKTPEWARIRSKRLAREPECRICERQKAFDSTFKPDPSWKLIVDHVTPHRGNRALFYSYDNTATICSHHHNSMKQSIEKRGHVPLTGIDGWPVEGT